MQHINIKKTPKTFKWKHFEPDIIYLRYPISYRDLQEMVLERGLKISHTTPAASQGKPKTKESRLR